MIWFACKQCGQRHQQPEDAAGSLIFCACGQANRVPWESTVPAPQERGDEDEGRPAARRRRWSEAEEGEREPARRPMRRRDPSHCLNHEEAPPEHTCPDCGEAFCPRCLIDFQGVRLCGPCKNYRVRKLQRPPHVAGLSIAALVVGLASTPLVFCMTIIPASQGAGPGVVLGVAAVGLVIGAAAVVLGLVGLREAERPAAGGGRGLALTGAACGVAGVLWALSLIVLMTRQLVQE
jgi:hypothetical protein